MPHPAPRSSYLPCRGEHPHSGCPNPSHCLSGTKPFPRHLQGTKAQPELETRACVISAQPGSNSPFRLWFRTCKGKEGRARPLVTLLPSLREPLGGNSSIHGIRVLLPERPSPRTHGLTTSPFAEDKWPPGAGRPPRPPQRCGQQHRQSQGRGPAVPYTYPPPHSGSSGRFRPGQPPTPHREVP